MEGDHFWFVWFQNSLRLSPPTFPPFLVHKAFVRVKLSFEFSRIQFLSTMPLWQFNMHLKTTFKLHLWSHYFKEPVWLLRNGKSLFFINGSRVEDICCSQRTKEPQKQPALQREAITQAAGTWGSGMSQVQLSASTFLLYVTRTATTAMLLFLKVLWYYLWIEGELTDVDFEKLLPKAGNLYFSACQMRVVSLTQFCIRVKEGLLEAFDAHRRHRTVFPWAMV